MGSVSRWQVFWRCTLWVAADSLVLPRHASSIPTWQCLPHLGLEQCRRRPDLFETADHAVVTQITAFVSTCHSDLSVQQAVFRSSSLLATSLRPYQPPRDSRGCAAAHRTTARCRRASGDHYLASVSNVHKNGFRRRAADAHRLYGLTAASWT